MSYNNERFNTKFRINNRFRPMGYEFINFSTKDDKDYWKYKLKTNLFNTIKPIKGAKIIYYSPTENKYYNENLEDLQINSNQFDGLQSFYENESYADFGGKSKSKKSATRKSKRKSTKKSSTKKSSTRKRHY